MMFKYPSFVYVASRGLAKSTLALIFATSYCILYPGTTVVVVAPTRGQSTRFVKKVQDLSRGRINLIQEIKDVKTGLNESRIDFNNGSAIITLPYSENSLGELKMRPILYHCSMKIGEKIWKAEMLIRGEGITK